MHDFNICLDVTNFLSAIVGSSEFSLLCNEIKARATMIMKTIKKIRATITVTVTATHDDNDGNNEDDGRDDESNYDDVDENDDSGGYNDDDSDNFDYDNEVDKVTTMRKRK